MAPVPVSRFPLGSFSNWNPFRLDALGLVTLLGADEVARAVGSLTHNALTDFLPMFGAYKVASDQIASVEPGFALYNLSDFIYVTELAPWFTRWLNMNLEHRYSILDWTIHKSPRPFRTRFTISAIALGCLVNVGLLALACVQGDWYGIANAVSMIISVLVRTAVCARHRAEVDAIARSYRGGPKKKFLYVTPDGKVAIGFIPIKFVGAMLDSSAESPHWALLPSAIRGVFPEKAWNIRIRASDLKSPKLKPYWDKLSIWSLRAAGWLAFGIQIVAIGQSNLLTQLCTVAVMTLASVAAIYGIGVTESGKVGAWFAIRQRQVHIFPDLKHGGDKKQGRVDAYAMLEPTLDEERWMRCRGLLPDLQNSEWYVDWNSLKDNWAKERSNSEAHRFLGLSPPAQEVPDIVENLADNIQQAVPGASPER